MTLTISCLDVVLFLIVSCFGYLLGVCIRIAIDRISHAKKRAGERARGAARDAANVAYFRKEYAATISREAIARCGRGEES